MAKFNEWLICPQPRLGAAGLLVLMFTASLLGPAAMDLYSPAIPTMAAYFSTTPDLVNWTLAGYALFMAVGLLVFGAVSDKYGRRSVLVAGAFAFSAASLLCMVAVNIQMLIAFRILQALGSGAVASSATAVVKDVLAPQYRERALAIIQAMFVLGLVLAPVAGAAILEVVDWRGTFAALALLGAFELVLALCFRETLPTGEGRSMGGARPTVGSLPAPSASAHPRGVLSSLGGLRQVARNHAFMLFLFITSAFEIGYMGFVSVASYIYIDGFGFSTFGYSICFSSAAIACAVGSVCWPKISGRVSARRFTTVALVASVAIGIALLIWGNTSALVFCAMFALFAFFEAVVRIIGINVLLAQNSALAGAAASLINFARSFIGFIGMGLVMLPWGGYVDAVALLIAGGMALALAAWVYLLHSRLILKGVKDDEQPEGVLWAKTPISSSR
ncbi:MAG: multidrug effflux MFS transporter [Eggerthellaceae bacterium]|nr:multidrug effflux MFS transporter [Eggerthellaceae bacterium]